MKFSQWLETEELEKAASMAPASAEVIRSGLQPQVNSQEIRTKQKGHADRVQAVDAHIERIRHATKGIGHDSPELKKICDKIIALWDQFKEPPGDKSPGEPELQNQLPPGPGTFGMA